MMKCEKGAPVLQSSTSDFSTENCAVCGLPQLSPHNPLCAHGMNDEWLVHSRCYNSPAARQREEQLRRADPIYDRYWRLMTHRVPTTCPQCKSELDISPKAAGMFTTAWEINCTGCHRTRSEPSFWKLWTGDDPAGRARAAIEAIRDDFIRSRDLAGIDARVREVARRYDHYIPQPCSCGGRFSYAAFPRCPKCQAIVMDSYFHTLDEPLTIERKRRLEELMSRDVEMPQDWDDALGWDRFYSGKSDALRHYEASDLGIFDLAQLANLIDELRSEKYNSIWVPGCGVSILPRLLARFGFVVHATDISPSAIQAQKDDNFESEVEKMAQQVTTLCQGVSGSPGALTAAVHDFRTPYLASEFDLIINQKAIQGFSQPSMAAIAASHFAALKAGRIAIFDTMNVQGQRRDELEESLVAAGFDVPLFEANRRLRQKLVQTGIPHVFVLGRPMIPAIGPYADAAKREADTAILRKIFSERQSHLQAEYEEKAITSDTKRATVVYSTS